MTVAAVMHNAVQVHQPIRRHSCPEFLDQLSIEFSDLFRRKFHLPDECRATAEIHRRRRQRFFHGQSEMPVPVNAPLITDGLQQTAPQTDPHILNCVMMVHMQIPHRPDRQIHQGMPGQQRQHMIKEAHSG